MGQIEVEIQIGGRTFEVACQEGEQQYLLSAAMLLDAEAQVLVDQIGRIPEGRMLLMAGLMLADKTAGLEENLRDTDAEISALKLRIAELEAQPAPPPQEIQVPVLPDGVVDAFAELAARAEALAGTVEETLGGDAQAS